MYQNHPKPGDFNKVFRFDSWGEFLSYAKSGPSEMEEDTRTSRWDETLRANPWSGAPTLDAALKMAYQGASHELLEKSAQLSGPIFKRLSSLVEREEIVYDVEGGDIDVGRYCEGIPECCLRIEPVDIKGRGRKVVRLNVNLSVSAGVKANVIERKGIVVMALCELLEFAGFRTEINISTRNISIETTVRIKNSDQPLDKARAMSAFTSPATTRRFMFSVWETSESHVRNHCNVRGVGSSYGTPDDSLDKMDIYVGRVSLYDFLTVHGMEAWIIARLKECGLELKTEVKR